MSSLFSILSFICSHLENLEMVLQHMMWFISSCKQLLELITRNMTWIWYIAPLFYNSSVLYLSQFLSCVQEYNGRGVRASNLVCNMTRTYRPFCVNQLIYNLYLIFTAHLDNWQLTNGWVISNILCTLNRTILLSVFMNILIKNWDTET